MSEEAPPAVPSSPSSHLLRAPSDLLRATSETLAGGAAFLPQDHRAEGGPPNEATPINRQTSQRRQNSNAQVQERVVAELWSFASRYWLWIALFVICLISLMITIFVLFICAVVGAIKYNALPCDQPLKWYVLITVVWCQIPGRAARLVTKCFHLSPLKAFLVSTLFSIPGWLLIAWGMYMVHNVKTCPKTNPGLYWPTRRYIYGQVVVACLLIPMAILGALGYRRVLLVLNRLQLRPGCVQAVRKLPKVEGGSAELLDPDDGQVMSCAICIDPLSASGPSIVRTPCDHYFHEECLAEWCRNHLDCPLCRREVGEADPGSDQDTGASHEHAV